MLKTLLTILAFITVVVGHPAFAAGTLTKLNLYRDGNSANTMVRSAPFYIDAMFLAA